MHTRPSFSTSIQNGILLFVATYSHVHPMFPFLPERKAIDALALVASSPTSSNGTTGTDGMQASEGTTTLLFVICCYAGQLSSSSSDTLSTFSTLTNAPNLGGIANKIAADLWYEQSRTMVMNRLRRGGSSLEGVQTLLLCALRDQGKGRESQAWLLLGA